MSSAAASGREAPLLPDVSAAFVLQAVAVAAGVGSSAVIARALGAEGMGLAALALLVPGMLELFLGCGIGLANVYFLGSRRLGVTDLVGNSLAVGIAGSVTGVLLVVAVLVSGSAAVVLPGLSAELLLLASLALPIGLLNSYFAAIVQGLQRLRTVSGIGALQAVLAAIMTWVLVPRAGLNGVVIAAIAAGLVALVLLVVVLKAEGAVFRPSFRPSVARATLGFGLRGHLANVLQFLNYRLDLLLLNLLAGPAAVGIYAVAVRLAELLWHLPNAVGFVIFPRTAAAAPGTAEGFAARALRPTIALTAMGAVFIALAGRALIDAVFTPAFAGAFGPLLILLPGVVAMGGAKVLTNAIAGRGYPQYNSANAAGALVITVGLNLLLIPRFGASGAAAASSVAYVSVLGVALLTTRHLAGREVHVGSSIVPGHIIPGEAVPAGNAS